MNNLIGSIGRFQGIEFHVNPYVPDREVQYKFPKTKKKRILKKWRKNKSNFRLEPQIMIFDGKAFAKPHLIANLKLKLKR